MPATGCLFVISRPTQAFDKRAGYIIVLYDFYAILAKQQGLFSMQK